MVCPYGLAVIDKDEPVVASNRDVRRNASRLSVDEILSIIYWNNLFVVPLGRKADGVRNGRSNS